MTQAHSILVRKCQNILIRRGYWPEVLVQGAMRRNGRYVRFGMTPGAPDIHVVGKGFYIEVKIGDDTLSDDQLAWRERARRFGGTVYVVRSEEDMEVALDGINALQELLRALDRILWLASPLIRI